MEYIIVITKYDICEVYLFELSAYKLYIKYTKQLWKKDSDRNLEISPSNIQTSPAVC